jgi:transketolase
MRNAFIDTILRATLQRDDIFLISGDAGLGVFDEFKERCPDRFLNMGVAEQNTLSFAAGMSMTGYKVVVYNIIPFLLYRAFEQVRNDICYQKLPVILAGIGSGITYAPQGMTHYAIEDIGIARSMPNLSIISPIDPVEAAKAAQYALSADHPVYVRLAKRGEPTLHPSDNIDITNPNVLQDGRHVGLICHGSIGEEVLKAGRALSANGIQARIISMPMIQPVAGQALVDLVEDLSHIVTVEEHYTSCGLGNLMTDLVMEKKLVCSVRKLGIPHQFIHRILNTAGMRNHFGIDAAGIAATVREIVFGEESPALSSHGCRTSCHGETAYNPMDVT